AVLPVELEEGGLAVGQVGLPGDLGDALAASAHLAHGDDRAALELVLEDAEAGRLALDAALAVLEGAELLLGGVVVGRLVGPLGANEELGGGVAHAGDTDGGVDAEESLAHGEGSVLSGFAGQAG